MQHSTYTSSTDTKNGKSIYLAIELVVLFLLATAVWGLFSLPAVFHLGLAETPDVKVCTYDGKGSVLSIRYNTCMHALNVRLELQCWLIPVRSLILCVLSWSRPKNTLHDN